VPSLVLSCTRDKLVLFTVRRVWLQDLLIVNFLDVVDPMSHHLPPTGTDLHCYIPCIHCVDNRSTFYVHKP
jgi:hypothetical protein